MEPARSVPGRRPIGYPRARHDRSPPFVSTIASGRELPLPFTPAESGQKQPVTQVTRLPESRHSRENMHAHLTDARSAPSRAQSDVI